MADLGLPPTPSRVDGGDLALAIDQGAGFRPEK